MVVRLGVSDWHDHQAESLWAEPLAEGVFRIANIPFYADGLSYGDIVAVHEREGEKLITGVTRRGGHSTYRLFLTETGLTDTWLSHWLPLEDVGCTYERATKRLLGVDVPPEANIHVAYRLLDAGEQADIWSFQEGHCGHPL